METMLGQDYQDCTALHIEYGSLTHCTTAASVILFAVRFPSWLLRSSLLARYRCAAAARLFIPCPLQNPLLVASPLLMHFNLSLFSNLQHNFKLVLSYLCYSHIHLFTNKLLPLWTHEKGELSVSKTQKGKHF